jgi:hypothetical protein
MEFPCAKRRLLRPYASNSSTMWVFEMTFKNKHNDAMNENVDLKDAQIIQVDLINQDRILFLFSNGETKAMSAETVRQLVLNEAGEIVLQDPGPKPLP